MAITTFGGASGSRCGAIPGLPMVLPRPAMFAPPAVPRFAAMREAEGTALRAPVGDPGEPDIAELRRRVGEPLVGHAPGSFFCLMALATHQ